MVLDFLVFIGRFQPYHNGHHAVVTKALRRASFLVLLLGSAHRPRCTRNPWTFAEREAMVRACLSEADNRRVLVLPRHGLDLQRGRLDLDGAEVRGRRRRGAPHSAASRAAHRPDRPQQGPELVLPAAVPTVGLHRRTECRRHERDRAARSDLRVGRRRVGGRPRVGRTRTPAHSCRPRFSRGSRRSFVRRSSSICARSSSSCAAIGRAGPVLRTSRCS